MNIGHKLLYSPQPKDGPVLVAIEFQLDRSRGSKFVDLMREVRLIHLRNGAYSWQLFEDPSRLNTFRIEMMVPSWTQYMLQQERMTKADGEVIGQAESLHVGPNPPEVRTYLGVNKELLSHKHRDAERFTVRTPSKEAAYGIGSGVVCAMGPIRTRPRPESHSMTNPSLPSLNE